MDGAVVTVEASVVNHFRGKYTGLLHMARSAFIFKNDVRLGQTSAAVNARVFENSMFGDPHEREQRQQGTQPEFGALQRRRPLEIIQVDALRELFCRACACHCFLRPLASLCERRILACRGAACCAPTAEVDLTPGSSQRKLELSSAAPSPRALRRAKSTQAKAECAATATRAASDAIAPAA